VMRNFEKQRRDCQVRKVLMAGSRLRLV